MTLYNVIHEGLDFSNEKNDEYINRKRRKVMSAGLVIKYAKVKIHTFETHFIKKKEAFLMNLQKLQFHLSCIL